MSLEARTLAHVGGAAAAAIFAALALRAGPSWAFSLVPICLIALTVEAHIVAIINGWRFDLSSIRSYRASWLPDRTVRSVLRDWPEATRAARLATHNGTGPMPDVAMAVKVPRGVVLHIVTPARSALDQALHAAGPALSRHYGCPVEVGNTEGATTVAVVHYDPNAVARRSTHTKGNTSTATPVGDSRLITVGRDASGSNVTWTLTSLIHIAIQGMTRSGKSSLAYLFVAAMAGRRDTAIVGIDPGGALLGPLSEWVRSAEPLSPDTPRWHRHMQRLVGTDASADASAQMLEDVCDEMDRRIDHLRRTGRDKLSPDERDLPVLLVVIDEYPAVVARAQAHDRTNGTRSRTHPRIINAVGRLVREGAKANVQVMIIAQRFDANLLGGDVRSNFPTRITFRMDNADGVHMLHPDADADLVDTVTGFPPGRALVETPGHPRSITQIDHMTYEEYREAVAPTAPTTK